MNINFMTYFPAEKFPPNGKETNFVPKILACVDAKIRQAYKPKLHTFRNGKRQWKAGDLLHMQTGSRFRPRRFNQGIEGLLVCKAVQKVVIEWESPSSIFPLIKIDDRELEVFYHYDLATNDGFDTLRDFYCYFNENFEGQIIHWTDLKY